MIPSVGRIVHLRNSAGAPCKAAVIVAVHDKREKVDLFVFPTWGNGGGLVPGIDQAATARDAGWHEPERA